MLAIRCDADSHLGLGHLVRCAALASEARALGEESVFFMREPSPRVLGFAAQASGSEVVSVADCEASSLATRAAALDCSAVIVDGYGFAPEFYSRLRDTFSVVAIDDLADRALDVDFVVNQNPYAMALDYRVGKKTTLLLGPEYALVRPEFRRRRKLGPAPRSTSVRHLLVMMGGADAGGFTRRIVGALCSFEGRVTVVIGPAATEVGELRRLANGAPQVELLEGVHDMPALIASADLGIVGAGGTTWEFAVLGIPVLHVVLAPNQVKLARACESEGLSRSLGEPHRLSDTVIQEAVLELAADEDLRARMGRLGRQLVDGLGPRRVLAAIGVEGACGLCLRRARAADVRLVWQINNEAEVRRQSISTAAIPWVAHEKWYEEALQSPSRSLWIVEEYGQARGVVRLDVEGKQGVISIALAPEARARGIGSETIRQGCRRLLDSDAQLDTVVAWVRPGNAASVAAFRRAGFELEEAARRQDVDLERYVLRHEVSHAID